MDNKVKSLFFSQYLGQEIFSINEHIPHLYELQGGHLGDKGFMSDSFLLLRDISQLTDQEVIQCGQVGFDLFNCIGTEYKLRVIRELSKISLAAVSIDEKTCLVKLELSNVWKLNIAQIDYLRSIGILIPVTFINETGQPQTLHEKDILKLGWAKIQSNEH